jgi:hypothetical protein
VQRPLFAPFRQNVFLLKFSSNSPTTVLRVTSCIFPRHTLLFFTEYCFSPSLYPLKVQSPSHLFPLLSRIDSIAQVLFSCTDITKTHHTKGVKSSHCSKGHILHRDRAFHESPLQIRKASFGSQNWLKRLPSSFVYQPERFTEC